MDLFGVTPFFGKERYLVDGWASDEDDLESDALLPHVPLKTSHEDAPTPHPHVILELVTALKEQDIASYTFLFKKIIKNYSRLSQDLSNCVKENVSLFGNALEHLLDENKEELFDKLHQIIYPHATDDVLSNLSTYQSQLFLENPYHDSYDNWVQILGPSKFKIIGKEQGTVILLKDSKGRVWKYFSHDTSLDEKAKEEITKKCEELVAAPSIPSGYFFIKQSLLFYPVFELYEFQDMFQASIFEILNPHRKVFQVTPSLTNYLKYSIPCSHAKIRIAVSRLNLEPEVIDRIFALTCVLPPLASGTYKLNYANTDLESSNPHLHMIAAAISPLVKDRSTIEYDLLFQYSTLCNDISTLNHVLKNARIVDKFKAATQDPKIQMEIIRNPISSALLQGCLDAAYQLLMAKFPINQTVKVKRTKINLHTKRRATLLQTSNPIHSLFIVLKSCVYISRVDLNNVYKFLDAAFEAGISVNYNMDTSTNGEIEQSILEYCFFYRGKQKGVFNEVTLFLLERGARISERMAIHIKMEIEAKKDKTFVPYMLQQGHLNKYTADLLLSPQMRTPTRQEDISHQLVAKLTLLQSYIYTQGNNPLHADLSFIREMRLTKKSIKEFLDPQNKKNPVDITNPEIKTLSNYFSVFVSLYDRFVESHIFLTELRSVSYELRKKSKEDNYTPSRRLDNIYSLWGLQKAYGKKASQDAVRQLLVDRRMLPLVWKGIYERMTTALDKLNQVPYLQKFAITWVHGSGLNPGMVHTRQIKTAAEIFAEGIPNFRGQISGTEHSRNKTFISGSILSHHWGENQTKDFLYDANTRLLVSYLYATKKEGYTGEMSFNPQQSWQRANVQYFKTLLDKGAVITRDDEANWARFKIDIIRLRFTDPEANKKLSPLRTLAIDEFARLDAKHPLRDYLKQVLNSLDIELKYTLTPKDLEIIDKQIPVVFASVSVMPVPSNETIPAQFFAEGSQTLGIDIQVAFTHDEYIEEVRQQLEPLGVLVLGMDIAFALETMHVIKRTDDDHLKSLNLIDRTAIVIERDIRPWYEMPLPRNPTFLPEGATVREKYPHPHYGRGMTYDQYFEAVKEGRIPCRTIHGPLHMGRTAVLCLLIANLLSSKCKRPRMENLDLLLEAAAGHDSGRELDINRQGKDPWDIDSARMVGSLFQQKGVKAELIQKYFFSILEKDPHERKFTCDEQIAIHDADCAEYNRLIEKSKFRREELCFYAFDMPGEKGDYKDRLIDEMIAFIHYTETPEMRNKLEKLSTNIFRELLYLIDKEDYPLMYELRTQPL